MSTKKKRPICRVKTIQQAESDAESESEDSGNASPTLSEYIRHLTHDDKAVFELRGRPLEEEDFQRVLDQINKDNEQFLLERMAFKSKTLLPNDSMVVEEQPNPNWSLFEMILLVQGLTQYGSNVHEMIAKDMLTKSRLQIDEFVAKHKPFLDQIVKMDESPKKHSFLKAYFYTTRVRPTASGDGAPPVELPRAIEEQQQMMQTEDSPTAIGGAPPVELPSELSHSIDENEMMETEDSPTAIGAQPQEWPLIDLIEEQEMHVEDHLTATHPTEANPSEEIQTDPNPTVETPILTNLQSSPPTLDDSYLTKHEAANVSVIQPTPELTSFANATTASTAAAMIGQNATDETNEEMIETEVISVDQIPIADNCHLSHFSELWTSFYRSPTTTATTVSVDQAMEAKGRISHSVQEQLNIRHKQIEEKTTDADDQIQIDVDQSLDYFEPGTNHIQIADVRLVNSVPTTNQTQNDVGRLIYNSEPGRNQMQNDVRPLISSEPGFNQIQNDVGRLIYLEPGSHQIQNDAGQMIYNSQPSSNSSKRPLTTTIVTAEEEDIINKVKISTAFVEQMRNKMKRIADKKDGVLDGKSLSNCKMPKNYLRTKSCPKPTAAKLVNLSIPQPVPYLANQEAFLANPAVFLKYPAYFVGNKTAPLLTNPPIPEANQAAFLANPSTFLKNPALFLANPTLPMRVLYPNLANPPIYEGNPTDSLFLPLLAKLECKREPRQPLSAARERELLGSIRDKVVLFGLHVKDDYLRTVKRVNQYERPLALSLYDQEFTRLYCRFK